MEERDKEVLSLLAAREGAIEEQSQKEKKTMFKRSDWDYHVEQLRHTEEFLKRYNMTEESFYKLLEMLREHLTVDTHQSCRNSRGNIPIIPEVVLASGVRFLGGVRYTELADIFGYSTASAKEIVNTFLCAVNRCPQLLIELPSTSEELRKHADQWDNLSSAFHLYYGVVGAIDGWFAFINKPSSKAVTNQTDFFSEKYQRYGLNVQAVCDSKLRFIYLSISSPGKTNDAIAFHRAKSLQKWIEELPEEYFLIGDNAYRLNSTMLVPFKGSHKRNEFNRSYNFYLSQLHMRIEMALGRLTSKWRIFRRNLDFSLAKNIMIIEVAVKLHNYVIESDGVHFNSIPGEMSFGDFGVESLEIGPIEDRGYLPSGFYLDIETQTELANERRNNIVDGIRQRELLRSDYNMFRNNDADT